MIRFLCTSLLFVGLSATAEVYTWINEHGVKVYGDKPPSNAQKVELPVLQTVPTLAPDIKKETKEDTAEPEGFTGYNYFAVVTPKQDEMVTWEDQGTLSVQLHLKPGLQPGHEVTLLVDGKAVATEASLSFTIDQLERGAHLIHARIKHQGSVLITTNKRRIHVQRPSILSRPRTQ